jgi:hypothetical protein
MVVYSSVAKQDLIDILFGLLSWGKHELTMEHCERYVDDMVDIIDTISHLSRHSNCKYELHRQYGDKCFAYKRNSQTTWYIIYNWDKVNHIAYVNKILSNYTTAF